MQSTFDLLPALRGEKVFVACDYDFTLREVAPTPAEATLTPERRELLQGLSGDRLQLAIVTGRSLESIQAVTGLDLPYWVVCGGLHIHGRGNNGNDGLCWTHPQHSSAFIAAVRAVLEVGVRDIPSAWVENVGGMSVTVHWRQTPSEHHDRVARIVEETSARLGFRLIMDRARFGAMVEQPIDWDKGSALRKLLEMIGWNGAVVALGDSAADDPMFQVANEYGGYGVRVGDRPSQCARAHLESPHDVFRFFQQFSS